MNIQIDQRKYPKNQIEFSVIQPNFQCFQKRIQSSKAKLKKVQTKSEVTKEILSFEIQVIQRFDYM
jgi:hypothetical protein